MMATCAWAAKSKFWSKLLDGFFFRLNLVQVVIIIMRFDLGIMKASRFGNMLSYACCLYYFRVYQ